jgi:hypothetical protein
VAKIKNLWIFKLNFIFPVSKLFTGALLIVGNPIALGHAGIAIRLFVAATNWLVLKSAHTIFLWIYGAVFLVAADRRTQQRKKGQNS